MNTAWKILGAAGAFIGVFIVRHFFGTAASAAAVAVLLVAWWFLHRYTEKRLDGLYRQFQQLDSERKAEALSEVNPEIRRDIESRMANERNC